MGDRKQPTPLPTDQVRPTPPPAPPGRRVTRFVNDGPSPGTPHVCLCRYTLDQIRQIVREELHAILWEAK